MLKVDLRSLDLHNIILAKLFCQYHVISNLTVPTVSRVADHLLGSMPLFSNIRVVYNANAIYLANASRNHAIKVFIDTKGNSLLYYTNCDDQKQP